MMPGRFRCVMCGLQSVPMSYMSVMAGFLVISILVVRGSFPMVFRRVLVMFCRLGMVFCAFMFHVG